MTCLHWGSSEVWLLWSLITLKSDYSEVWLLWSWCHYPRNEILVSYEVVNKCGGSKLELRNKNRPINLPMPNDCKLILHSLFPYIWHICLSCCMCWIPEICSMIWAFFPKNSFCVLILQEWYSHRDMNNKSCRISVCSFLPMHMETACLLSFGLFIIYCNYLFVCWNFFFFFFLDGGFQIFKPKN